MKRISLALLPLLAAACVAPGTQLPPVGMTADETAAAAAEDTCGADGFAYLVGQPRSALAGVGFPEGTRVLLPTSIVTQDFLPTRLNVVIDGNAEVERLYCG